MSGGPNDYKTVTTNEEVEITVDLSKQGPQTIVRPVGALMYE
eukprot:gene4651-5094_t